MLEESILIPTTAERAFDLSQDYARRLTWDPFLRSADLLDGAVEAAVGVRSLCVSRDGWAMETEYVTFERPRVAAVKMTSGPWMLESFAGSWRFEEESPGVVRVGFRYQFRVWPGWLAWAIAPLVASSFAADTRKRLEALKQALENGNSLRHQD